MAELITDTTIAVPKGFGPMAERALRYLPRPIYRSAGDGVWFTRGRLMLFGLELSMYAVSGQTSTIVSMSFTCGLFSLRKSAQELSEWALQVYGRERYYEGRETLGLGPEVFPRTEGQTVRVAPFVSRDYKLRNYSLTDVRLFMRPDTELVVIEYRT